MIKHQVSLIIYAIICSALYCNGAIISAKKEEKREGRVETQCRYIAVSDQTPKYSFELIAEKSLISDKQRAWTLRFTICDAKKEPAKSGNIKTLDTKDIIIECVDRLVADCLNVTDPNIDMIWIYVDLQLDPMIWSGVEKELIPIFRKWKGVVSETDVAKQKEIAKVIHTYLKQSTEVQELAQLLANKLKCNQKIPPGLSSEGVRFSPDCYGLQWSDLPKRPHLGIAMQTARIGIYLEPNSHAHPMKGERQ